MAGQSIRRSQFITTYGPGAILEGPDGPRIIHTLDRSGLFNADRTPSRFEVRDLRLSSALLDNTGIVRLPSNAELGTPDERWIYNTSRFPQWSLCVRHRRLYRKRSDDGRTCPECRPERDQWAAWAKCSLEAIRFVRACPKGHLDDVDWHFVVRTLGGRCNPDRCRSDFFIWENSGGALRNVHIRCPVCGGAANLGTAYAREWGCSDRFPELEHERHGDCSERSKLVQRGAANLFLPAIVTSLTIPPRATPLHTLLESRLVRAVLVGAGPDARNSKSRVVDVLRQAASAGIIPRPVVDSIEDCTERALVSALADVMTEPGPQLEADFRRDEFNALREAASSGYPGGADPDSRDPPLFEVQRDRVRIIHGPNGRALRICPVNRLRVVMVQIGYRRVDPVTSEVVDRKFSHPNEGAWYPGVELFGEGVFIDLPPDGDTFPQHPGLLGREVAEWRRELDIAEADPASAFGDPLNCHPVFVWWHTFAHRLITALSLDCGYSSAALRERVYLDRRAGSDGAGGVLIYTAQPGGDGTLGGLVALVPQFERILYRALQDVDSCSNDPLCGDEAFVANARRINGAACYACLLVSETSCEHRNTRLDRNLFRTNLP